MKTSGWLFLAAVVCLVIGLAFGFAPVHSDGYNCGNGFRQSSQLETDRLFNTLNGGDGSNSCDAARSNRAPFIWAAGGLALLLGFAGAATLAKERDQEDERRRLERQRS